MTTHNDLNGQQALSAAFLKPAIVGAAIGFIFMALFLAGVNDPNPEWGKYWMVRPLVVTPIAGFFGGAFYHLMGQLRRQGGIKKVMGFVIGVLGFIVILWLGAVYGMDGNLWD